MTPAPHERRGRRDGPDGSYEADPDRSERTLFFLTVGLLAFGGLLYLVLSQF
jgi:hypothetical protein